MSDNIHTDSYIVNTIVLHYLIFILHHTCINLYFPFLQISKGLTTIFIYKLYRDELDEKVVFQEMYVGESILTNMFDRAREANQASQFRH